MITTSWSLKPKGKCDDSFPWKRTVFRYPGPEPFQPARTLRFLPCFTEATRSKLRNLLLRSRRLREAKAARAGTLGPLHFRGVQDGKRAGRSIGPDPDFVAKVHSLALPRCHRRCRPR